MDCPRLFRKGYGAHRSLHSFPTRRSSDLRVLRAAALTPVRVAPLPELEHPNVRLPRPTRALAGLAVRSEEHTSELQSPCNLVCRLLLEKKKVKIIDYYYIHMLR